MGRSLDQRARDALIPEPIIIVVEGDAYHFATEALPLRTIFDVRGGIMFMPGLKIEEPMGNITITLDGRTVTYTRRGYDIHGRWICDLAR
jgi:hypothetical protein